MFRRCVLVFCFFLAHRCGAADVQYCPFFGNRGPSPQPNLQNCSWFNENSCCLNEEINSIFPTVLPPDRASQTCRDYIRFQMCFVCDPAQASYYANDQLTLCEEYCNDMYSACAEAVLEGQTIGQTYSTGKEYCQALSFAVAPQSSGECFTFDPANSGSRLLPNLWLVLVAALFFGRATGTSRGVGLLLVVLALFAVRGRGQAVTEANVRDWAQAIGSNLVQLAEDGLQVKETQNLVNENSFLIEDVSGPEMVHRIASGLEHFFNRKLVAAQQLAAEAKKLYEDYRNSGDYVDPSNTERTVAPNQGLGTTYSDADFPSSLPPTTYSDVFKKKVSFERSVVKFPDSVSRGDARAAADVKWTDGLDELFKKNYNNDSSLRWQYFASPRGLVRIYPSYEWERNFAGFHRDYDPRIRPWYVSSTSGPKNVMIVLDCSSSMSGARWQIAKAAARTILNTLTQQDYVNAICARGSYWSYYSHYRYFTTRTLGCLKSGLLPATTSIKRDLMEKIDEIEPDGRSLFVDAMRKTMDVFQLSKPPLKGKCQNVAIFLTDGLRQDGNDVRCEPGYYTYSYSNGHVTRTYHPGRKCNEEWDEVWEELETRNPFISDKVHFFAYSVVSGDTGRSLPSRVACQNYGSFGELHSPFNTYENLTNYYNFLSLSTMTTSLVWTAPYIDVFGLGLLVTIAVPVYLENSQEVVGVVGIDATLEGIENLLNARTWGSVYSFLINQDGDTVIHPRLRPSANLVDDPVYPKIQELEQSGGKPAAFSSVLSDMLAGKEGSASVTGPRFVAKGDFQDGFEFRTQQSIYYYAPVENTGYYMAINIPLLDAQYHQADQPANVSKLPTTYYYRIDEYIGALKNDFPGALAALDVRENVPGYADLRIAFGKSVVKLAPRAFCDPLRFLVEEYPGTVDVHRFLNSNSNTTANPGCAAAATTYARAIRPASQLTSKFETIWSNRPANLPVRIASSYVGTQSGLWRVLPGFVVSRSFDPTARPWFKRAVANPAKLALSPVYLDAGGVGKVVTLSEVIFQAPPVPGVNQSVDCGSSDSKPATCSCASNSDCSSSVCRSGRCTSEHPFGVVGIDVRYSDFHRYVVSLTDQKCGSTYRCASNSAKQCQTRCYLVDDLGHLVLDEDIGTADDADERNYLNVPFGYREGKVMTDLVYNKGVFERSVVRDYQGLCDVAPYAPRVTNEGVVFTAEEERQYVLTRGDIRKFQSQFGCVQDVVGFSDVVAKAVGVLQGSAKGPCGEGNYFVSAVPETNLYLVVIDNWNGDAAKNAFNFNCHIANRVSTAGAFRVSNQTCSQDVEARANDDEQCPALRSYTPPCVQNNRAFSHVYSSFVVVSSAIVTLVLAL